MNRLRYKFNILKLRQVLLFLFLIGVSGLFAQQSRLANQYYANGEYEKAASLYQQLYEKESNNEFYFQRLTECMITLKQYEQVKSVIQKEIKQRPDDLSLIISLGNLYDRMSQGDLAKVQYEKALSTLKDDINQISKLSSTFNSYSLFDYSIATLEKGGKLLNNKKIFAYNLGELYRRTGDSKNMIANYLLSIEQFAGNLETLKQTFDRNLNEDEIKELQSQIFALMQENTSEMAYPELLEWTYIQQKDYKKALRQSKSIELNRENGNGDRVFNLGNIAYNDEEYDVAIDAYSYITQNYSINSSFYLNAKRSLLNAKKNKITKSFTYTKEDLTSLKEEYLTFLNEYGRNSQTALLMIEYSDFEALYLNNLPEARKVLDEVINFGGIQPNDVATAKLKLGDYFLMDEDRWEASLLYSQVDKSFKEGVLGEEARYRNAKLSYYTGDFEWAQQQFDILKSATTRLISNDAIDMSVFIMDNLNLDTTDATLGMFADAELLVFQNKFDAAIMKLDSVALLYPEHSLVDDIYYTKAQIYKKLKQPEKAIELYNKIIEKYKEEIRCDNAIYELAKMYDYQLNDKAKAQELYYKLFTEFTGSTFVVDARKRYRVLRGDDMEKS